MGLAITAYSGLAKRSSAHEEASGDPRVEFYINEDFPDRHLPIEEGEKYGFDDCYDFHVGPYSYYNQFREALAKLAGYPAVPADRHGVVEQRHDVGAWAAQEGPLWELINFSDCSGVIGSVAAAKLIQDFDRLADRVGELNDEDYQHLFGEFRTAFQMAANGGAVVFH